MEKLNFGRFNKIIILLPLLFLGIAVLTGMGLIISRVNKNQFVETKQIISNQYQLTLSQLKQYDGSDQVKPILLAYHGALYDVSAGKKYYGIGATYHFLVGKDSTTVLDFIGGEIIKVKYPVVGKVIN